MGGVRQESGVGRWAADIRNRAIVSTQDWLRFFQMMLLSALAGVRFSSGGLIQSMQGSLQVFSAMLARGQ